MKKTPAAEAEVKGLNTDQAPLHVTEEQAALDHSMGQTPPDIEQGTPVQEVSSKSKKR